MLSTGPVPCNRDPIVRALTRPAGGGSIRRRLCSAMQVPNGEHSGRLAGGRVSTARDPLGRAFRQHTGSAGHDHGALPDHGLCRPALLPLAEPDDHPAGCVHLHGSRHGHDPGDHRPGNRPLGRLDCGALRGDHGHADQGCRVQRLRRHGGRPPGGNRLRFGERLRRHQAARARPHRDPVDRSRLSRVCARPRRRHGAGEVSRAADLDRPGTHLRPLAGRCRDRGHRDRGRLRSLPVHAPRPLRGGDRRQHRSRVPHRHRCPPAQGLPVHAAGVALPDLRAFCSPAVSTRSRRPPGWG